MEETPQVCGTAGFEFISELPGFILYVRCFLKKQTKEVILLHDSLSLESFPGLGWRGDAVPFPCPGSARASPPGHTPPAANKKWPYTQKGTARSMVLP